MHLLGRNRPPPWKPRPNDQKRLMLLATAARQGRVEVIEEEQS